VRRINVLHLRDTHEIGGPGKTILETCRFIDSSRFALQLAVFLTRHETGESPFVAAAKAQGIPVHFLRGYNQYDPTVIARLIALCKAQSIDILHAHEPKSDGITYVTGKLHRVRTMTTLHGWISGSTRRRMLISLDKRLVSRFDRVIVVSSLIRDQMLAAGARPETLRLLHNAIVLERYRRTGRSGALAALLGTQPAGPVLGSIGRISPEKGHLDLVEALALVAQRGHRVSAVFIGDGPSKAAVIERVRALGLEQQVYLPGYLADPQRFLEDLDLMVLPSHTEGLPNAVLEALAMEVPVLATRVGGTPEIVTDGETGRLVPPKAPEAMAEAILEFLADREGWRAMAVRGREVVESEFDFTVRTRRLEAIYTELMEART
jgi:glycosyltransferase involved in cell wall biosynthesis